MGYVPQAHQPNCPSSMPGLEKRKSQLKEIRNDTQEAMTRTQKTWAKPSNYKPPKIGDKVWLDGKNLQTFHPTNKLCPKRFGPFAVKEVLGPTSYHLELPPTWTIHNAFHGLLLEPYIETSEHGRNYDKPPPDLVEGKPEYKVKALLGS